MRFLWPRNDTARRMSLFIAHPLVAEIFNEGGNVLGSPDGSAGAEFDRFGIAPGTAAFPPGTFADGKDGKNLGQAKKTIGGNGRLVL